MRRFRALRAAVVLAIAALFVLVASCGTDAPQIDAEDPTPTAEATPDDTDAPMDDPDVPERHRDATRLAVEDLADRTGTDPGDIEVVSAQDVTWRDGSIGCPEPGGMYTQALVEGYRIVLEVDGERHHYHGADGEPPFRCPEERRQEPHGADR